MNAPLIRDWADMVDYADPNPTELVPCERCSGRLTEPKSYAGDDYLFICVDCGQRYRVVDAS